MGCGGTGIVRFRRHSAYSQSGLFAVDPPEPCPGCPDCRPWDFPDCRPWDFEELEPPVETAQEAWERARLDEENA